MMDAGKNPRAADARFGDLTEPLVPWADGSLLRGTLFASGALLAIALVVVSIAETSSDVSLASAVPGLDMMATGSIGDPVREYTIRRSVLQSPGTGPCILFADGTTGSGC